MKKKGRPLKGKKPVRRISVSISEEAYKVFTSIPSGKRSEFVEEAILIYKKLFPYGVTGVA